MLRKSWDGEVAEGDGGGGRRDSGDVRGGGASVKRWVEEKDDDGE